MPAQPRHNGRIVLKAAGLYFAAALGAGLVLGTIRVLWLEPQVGSRAAELIELPFMLGVIILAGRWIVQRLDVPRRARYRLGMGGLALALLLGAEFALVLPLRGESIAEYWASFDRVSGSAYYASLVFYGVLPLLLQSERWYWRHAAALGATALAVLVLGLGYTGYVADLERAERRIAVGGSVAQTACGPIEYADVGEGPALLLVHGAGGGFDQGLELAGEIAEGGFRVITMSRFGYLGTPLPADASPQAQADAHACLLDALKIQRAAIAGISAGGPSSLQFALRHRERATALVLLVPLAYAPRTAKTTPLPSGFTLFMLERAVRSDLLYWLALRLAPGIIVKTILATPPEVLAEASADEKARVDLLMENILPLSRRQAGLLNDASIAQRLGPDPLERIAVPTLIISLADDLYGTFETSGYTASLIKGAHFIGYARGGHVWVGHHSAIVAEIQGFLGAPQSTLARR
jgi:2-hydroxy-6-oxonona-2,4-dienedioate hydrolase